MFQNISIEHRSARFPILSLDSLSQVHTADFYRCDMRFFFTVAAHSRLLSLLETISEALLREIFFWGCVGGILQANSLLFYWLSMSRGPRFLSRNTARSRFLSLVSCDQKQISNMLDLRNQSLVIKSVRLASCVTAHSRFFRPKTKSRMSQR